MIDPEDAARLAAAAADLLDACREAGIRLATAESCTGGMIGAALTAVPGSSDVVDRGFIVYSNEAKSELLAVPPTLLTEHGAVSEPVARTLAQEAAARLPGPALSIAVTGIAGPGGGTAEKPEGRVHIAACRTDAEGGVLRIGHRKRDYGALGRAAVRAETALDAIALGHDLLSDPAA